MILITILLVAGILCGYLLRERKKIIGFCSHLTSVSIYLLLLTLGISIGLNKDFIQNIHLIGFKALIITLFSILGSIILALFIYRIYFKQKA